MGPYIFLPLSYSRQFLGRFYSILHLLSTVGICLITIFANSNLELIRIHVRHNKWCRNSRGYEIAKRFNSKFTHLSPVWYDLKRCVWILIIHFSKSCILEVLMPWWGGWSFSFGFFRIYWPLWLWLTPEGFKGIKLVFWDFKLFLPLLALTILQKYYHGHN